MIAMVIVDSREKRWEHIETYFQIREIPYRVQKLDIADYMLEGNDRLVIDRKRTLDEVAQNLCTKDKGRFWREVRLAHSRHVKMIVLVECGGKYHEIKDVAAWHSKYSRITGRQVMEEMYRTHMAYGVEWLFCDKRKTGKRILELLTQEEK